MNLFRKRRDENYNHLEVIERPSSFTTESIHKLIINLEYANVDKKYKAIQITSSLSSEGKTTLIGNMAVLLAQRNHKVIIIDLDLRKPKVNRLFGASNDVGITNYLHGSASLEEVIKNGNHGVDLIVAGERTSAVVNLLESEKLTELIAILKEKYDYILLDTPPVQVNADAMMVSRITDGVVYVIGYNIVKKNIIRDAVESLRRTEIPIIGVVLTQVKYSRRSGDYYHYYYYYGDN
ncbi:MAG: CpsD/CapB family tyrosine-protein kinase [Acholeplasmataceae bacterium]|jgi:capsular exopolysaccharide synthesis family protein|nr:CpsD/CapB family tyrosine-protein kinase [Acholeplasmataceae bacterium]